MHDEGMTYKNTMQYIQTYLNVSSKEKLFYSLTESALQWK